MFVDYLECDCVGIIGLVDFVMKFVFKFFSSVLQCGSVASFGIFTRAVMFNVDVDLSRVDC